MNDTEQIGRLEVLTHEECLRLLVSHGVGRLAIAVPDASPIVVPVNYLMDGAVVVFRSGTGMKLRAMRGTPVSFQIDDIDPVHRTGWSVLVRGKAYEASHWEIDHLSLDTWAPGEKSHWIRIVPDAFTGRRLNQADGFVDLGGYL